MASRISSMPSPALALATMASSAGIARMSSSCFLTVGISAFGRSILLMTGMIVRPLLERQMNVGHGLGLDPLRGIHDEQRAFAGGQAAGDFIGEIDVPRRIEQVEPVVVAVLRLVFHRHRMRLDGDAAFALQIHRIEQLVLLIALGDRAGALEQAVGQRGLAVVDVRDDAEIARAFDGHRERWGNILDRNGPVNIAN